jgi:hypothetical protein
MKTAVEWLEFRYKNNISLNQYDFEQAKEMEKEQKGFSDVEVELIANEIVNWTLDNIGNPNPQSGKKFDEIMSKFKKK